MGRELEEALKHSGVPYEFIVGQQSMATFRTMDDSDASEALRVAGLWSVGQLPQHWPIWTGPERSGKSHLAAGAIAATVVEHVAGNRVDILPPTRPGMVPRAKVRRQGSGIYVRFDQFQRFSEAQGHPEDGGGEAVRQLAAVPQLALDDLGTMQPTRGSLRTLLWLLRERADKRMATALATRYSNQELVMRFSIAGPEMAEEVVGLMEAKGIPFALKRWNVDWT